MLALLVLAVGHGRVAGELDEDPVDSIRPDRGFAPYGEQEGAHLDAQQALQFIGGPSGVGLPDDAEHGGGESAVVGEAWRAQGGQAKAVEALRLRQGVRPAIVFVAAQEVDSAQVAEGGGERGVVEGLPELAQCEWVSLAAAENGQSEARLLLGWAKWEYDRDGCAHPRGHDHRGQSVGGCPPECSRAMHVQLRLQRLSHPGASLRHLILSIHTCSQAPLASARDLLCSIH